MENEIKQADKAVKAAKEKKPTLSFKTFRNGAVWTPVRAKSFDLAVEDLRAKTKGDKGAHYEIKNEAGRLVPVM